VYRAGDRTEPFDGVSGGGAQWWPRGVSRSSGRERGVGARAAPEAVQAGSDTRLRAIVEAKLGCGWSPEQISGWLTRTYPEDREMRVSHETIYVSLFVQSRGCVAS
jgi:IS30 family transposase